MSYLYLNHEEAYEGTSSNNGNKDFVVASLFKRLTTTTVVGGSNTREVVILSFIYLEKQLNCYFQMRNVSEITHVFLENNGIHEIEDDDIKKLNNPFRNLQYINLNKNKLSKISIFNFSRLFTNLNILILSNNLISDIKPHSIPIYGSIKVLDLSNNRLSKLDGLLPLKFSLQILNVQNNLIETFEDMKHILSLEQLTNFDFRGNPIKSLEEENLIYEEIVNNCNNVWFINGNTILANNGKEGNEEEEIESLQREEELNSCSYGTERTCSPSLDTIVSQRIAGSLPVSPSSSTSSVKSVELKQSLFNDPSLVKNLTIFALSRKNRVKRSGSCPSITSPHKRDGNKAMVREQSPIKDSPKQKSEPKPNTNMSQIEDDEYDD
ncbi:hypothetical protein ABK040_005764 [Willaertia magna]